MSSSLVKPLTTRSRITTVVAVAAALALTGIASSAQAAGTRSLPDGNSLYAITCPYYSDALAQTPNNQVLALDEHTAVAVAVGSGSEIESSNCAGSPALDPTTGIVYALVEEDDYDFPYLVRVDLVTGVSTKVADISYLSDPYYANALAIGLDGAAYVLYDGDLFSLNLADGVLTLVGSSLVDTWGFVSDPVTGLFYAMDEYGEVFEVDVTDGSFTSLGQLPFVTDDEAYSLTMDSNGVFWMGRDISTDEYQMELWSFTLADPAGPGEMSGVLSLGSKAPYSEALVIGPKYVAPALAATGADTSAPITAGIVLLAAGVLLVVGMRRRLRTA